MENQAYKLTQNGNRSTSLAMLNEEKVSHVAAYFLKLGGGRMPHMKLLKLLYLSDRESFKRYGFSISGDSMVSMKYGPVLSETYELMNGSKQAPNAWDSLISPLAKHEVGLEKEVEFDELDELSQADVEIIKIVWEEYGEMNQWKISQYTHDNCPEWKDPNGSSHPIPLKRILKETGWSDKEIKIIIQETKDQVKIDKLFASL